MPSETLASGRPMSFALHKQTESLELKARKIKPGTWIRVAYKDSKPEVVLFLRYASNTASGEYPVRYRGDRTMECYYPKLGITERHDVHTQVVEIMTKLAVPK